MGGRFFLDRYHWSVAESGVKVISAQIPMTSLSDDVAALQLTLERANTGPILLVAHSYSGAVITALSGDARVRGIVYIAAMPPAEGETVGELFFKEPPHEKAPPLEPDSHGFLWILRRGCRTQWRTVPPQKERKHHMNTVEAPIRD